ncbi:MAG: hypothetical protein P1P76_11950 [Anaerolineales bacterium]|nr:hypothetical protein [Anaerolineales bacterium]
MTMRLLPGPRTVDDAFITFRYARNLLAGNGLVYNPGEWVLGTTTPLYALLLSGLGLVSGGADADFPLIALVVNGLFDALTCYILIRFGESLARPRAGTAAALIWAITPMSVSFAIGGMETSLLILLMSATFYFHLKHRSVLAALFAGLSVLTRPDALLFVVLIGVDRLIHWVKKTGSKPNAAEILSFSVPLAIWIMISSTAYGTPVPHSIAAKTSAYILPGDAALIRLLQHFATPFFGQNFFGNWWIGLGIIIFPSLFITGWRHALQDFRHAWPMALYPAFYFSVFTLANPLIFRWYLTPPLPMYFIGIFLGLTDIGRQTRKTWISTAAIAIAFALTVNAWTLRPDHGLDRPAPEMAYIKLENSYHEAASIVAPLLDPGDTIAAGDIGVLGYKTGAHILDTVGLISPQSTQYYPISEEKYVINYAIPSELILIEAPDYIVVLEVYGRETFMKEVNFIAHYALVATIETDIYGTDGMLIFERK